MERNEAHFVVYCKAPNEWTWKMVEGNTVLARAHDTWTTQDDAFKACCGAKASMEHAEIEAD